MRARVIYDFSAQGDGELSVACGEEVTIIDQSVGDGWWNAVNAFGRSGLVPSSFVEPFDLPEPAVPPPPPPTFVSQSPDWDEDWDSDDSAPGSEPTRTPLEKTSNGGPHRPSNGPLPSDSTWKHSGSIGSVPPYSDSIRTAPIRRHFSRAHIRSGAEDFLLRIEPPPSPRVEAVIEYANGMFIWQPASSVIQCKISSFHKDSKMKGMKSFIAYQLTSQLVPSHVSRRYKHFDWLHARLVSKYPCVCIPPLPEKAITGICDCPVSFGNNIPIARLLAMQAHIRSGAEDFLLRIEPPPSPRVEAVIEYANGMFIWQPASSVIQCKISSFHKDSKMKGMKSFIAYQLTSQLVPSHVSRRYKHFDWLHARLVSKYPCVCIPPLPEKAITGRYDDDFVDERRKGLQQWLDRMCRHPVVSQCDVLRHFLSCTDEKLVQPDFFFRMDNLATSQLVSHTDFCSARKREAETDRLQGIRYYYAVVSREPLQNEDYSTTQAEGTEKFAIELERGVRALSDTINDFHRKLSTNARKDFISLSGAFYGMCRALDGDTHSNISVRPLFFAEHLNSHLYAALSNVGETFKSISLCHAVESESFVQLNECLREYVRVLSTLPPVVNLGKSACLIADEVRRLLSEEKLSKQDASNILSGSLVITRALQAECNLIMSQLRQELLERVKAYLTDRANFYRQLAAQLDSVASVF
ncbi:hypothetical protein AHF37_03286 [Paragonimus kellicotti]|nr:hypothetical protein AHF37_03286 [Paragonimus kellicotti]